jgi:hypothetical protein
MTAFVTDHPYLVANIPVLLAILVAARRLPESGVARLLVPAGLLCLPSALIAFTFDGDYWSPPRLGDLAIGLEDLIFCFDCGALAWLAAAFPFRQRIVSAVCWRTAGIRFTALGLVGGSVIVGCHLAGCHSMVGFSLACLTTVVVVLFLRAELWPLAITGAVLYTAIHVLSVRVQFSIWPQYSGYWNQGGILGATIAGVPLIEPVWAVIFGASWPMIVGYVFNVGLDRDPDPAATGHPGG